MPQVTGGPAWTARDPRACAVVAVGVAVLATLALAGPASCQEGFRVSRLWGAYGVGLGGDWVDRQSAYDTREQRIDGWVDGTLEAYWRNPGTVHLTLRVNPRVRQGQFTPDSVDTSRPGWLKGGAMKLSLFSNREVGGSVTASQRHSWQQNQWGGFSDSKVSLLRATYSDRNPLLPIKAVVEERRESGLWSPGVGHTLDLSRRTRRYQVSAGSSKTQLSLDQSQWDLGDRGQWTDRSGRLRHNALWGKGSRLSSTWVYRARDGENQYRRLSVSERARLRHTDRWSSEWGYRLSKLRHAEVAQRTSTREVEVRYQLSQAVTFRAGGDLRSEDVGQFRRTRRSVEAGTSFLGQLPFDAQLTGALAVEVYRDRMGSDAPVWASATREEHVVGPGGWVELESPFADPASVLILAEDSGARLEPELDYRIVLSGPYVRVQVIPGGRVGEGERLFVDYRYELMPAVASSATAISADVRVRRHGLEVYHRRRTEAGGGEVPTRYRSMQGLNIATSGFLISGRLAGLQTTVEAARTRSHSASFDFSDNRASLGVQVPIGSRVRMVLNGSISRLDDRSGSRIHSNALGSSLSWSPSGTVHLTGRASRWTWVSPDRDDFLNVVGLDLTWRTFAGEVEGRYDWLSFRRFNTGARHRLAVNVRKTFRGFS